ncbi:hypothetical protein BDQ12DRAFT_668910 [Crucibulum laeve]|uniref:Uncharacterized protein n=1 Tax=Crucibulum laeve TaxID=68775 RepID=A0A5C3LR49_9AGAR|nr:hypothetical protein BDQ12DRAFT_668910 [Crucibulum laeve]
MLPSIFYSLKSCLYLYKNDNNASEIVRSMPARFVRLDADLPPEAQQALVEKCFVQPQVLATATRLRAWYKKAPALDFQGKRKEIHSLLDDLNRDVNVAFVNESNGEGLLAEVVDGLDTLYEKKKIIEILEDIGSILEWRALPRLLYGGNRSLVDSDDYDDYDENMNMYFNEEDEEDEEYDITSSLPLYETLANLDSPLTEAN